MRTPRSPSLAIAIVPLADDFPYWLFPVHDGCAAFCGTWAPSSVLFNETEPVSARCLLLHHDAGDAVEERIESAREEAAEKKFRERDHRRARECLPHARELSQPTRRRAVAASYCFVFLDIAEMLCCGGCRRMGG